MNVAKRNIWTSIKNIYNNSPWHASFTYPILYILISAILVGILGAVSASLNFEYTFLLNMVLIFMLSIYFVPPIWVFVGLILSKKKKPYILSLIIGLGLLSILLLFAQIFGANLEVK